MFIYLFIYIRFLVGGPPPPNLIFWGAPAPQLGGCRPTNPVRENQCQVPAKSQLRNKQAPSDDLWGRTPLLGCPNQQKVSTNQLHAVSERFVGGGKS